MSNDSDYRAQRRLTAYVDPKIKRKVIVEGGKVNRTPSQEVAFVLTAYYERKKN